MARRDDNIDACVEALKRVDDEHLASLSHSPAAQALYEEVTSMSRSTRATGEKTAATESETRRARKPRSRRRLAWETGAVVGAAAIVLAVLSIVNVFGSNGPSIVEKAVAALDPGQNAIVHVKISGHETGKDGYSGTWTEESWSRTEAPYTSRLIEAYDGAPATETVQDNTGLAQVYDAATNIIYQPPQSGVFRTEGDQSDAYRDMILEMLSSGDAVVEGNETVDGRDCLRIAATKDYGTATDGTKYGTWYLVDAGTKNPVEWRMTRDGGKAVTIHFDVYEHLAANAGNLALLDLAVQHPGAPLNTSAEDYRKSLGIEEPGPAGDPSVKNK
jgi:hypothetical protein